MIFADRDDSVAIFAHLRPRRKKAPTLRMKDRRWLPFGRLKD